ncbi:MAG TPA: MAPEG family protein [Bradyrhizobium sp.]|nr:MAPEG family protein [Bradyrhizobium sp.]
MQPLPTEIVMLGIGVVLLIVQLFLQSVSSAFEVGGEYKAGSRDDARIVQGKFAGRAERAFRNLLETFPAFAVLALALTVTGRNGGYGALGAEVWVVARVLYVPLYLFHIPFVRSAAWFVSIFALLAMLIRLFE